MKTGESVARISQIQQSVFLFAFRGEIEEWVGGPHVLMFSVLSTADTCEGDFHIRVSEAPTNTFFFKYPKL